jgi:hypothetical protein
MSSAVSLPMATVPSITPRPRDVLRAIVRRFARRGALSIYVPLLIFCGMPTLVYGMLRLTSPEVLSTSWEDPSSLRRLYFIFAATMFPTLILIEMMAQLRPLYALPLTTRRIVNTQFALGMLVIIGTHLLTALYYRFLFGASIPVLGPLLILIPMMFVCAGSVALWIEAVWWRMLLAIGLLSGFGWWWGRQLSDEALRSDSHWMTPTPGELLLLLALGTAGYVVTYRTVVRDRRGDTGAWENLEVYLHRLLARLGRLLPRHVRVWSSAATRTAADDHAAGHRAQAACASYEWHTRGLVLPIVALGLGSVSLISAWFDPATWLNSYVLALPALLVLGLGINGYFVGMVDGPDWNGEMDRYRATRPLRDVQLARVLLKNGLLSGGVALLVTAALAIVVYIYALLTGPSHDALTLRMTSGIESTHIWAILACSLAGWAGMGFNLSCSATGRHLIIPTVWMAGMAWMVGYILMATLIGEEQMKAVTQTVLLAVGLFSAIGTVWCYHRAISHELLGRHSWLWMCGLWILGAGLLIASLQLLEMTATTVVTLIGLGSLVALPIASVPLAVWWNRHR